MMAQCTFTICENPAVPMLQDWWGAVQNQYLIIPIWQTDIIGHQSQTLHFMRWNQMYLLQQLWMENLSNLNKYFFMYVLISCWFNLSQFFKSFQHWLWKSSMKLRIVVSLKHTLRYLISNNASINILPLFSILLAHIRACSLNYFPTIFTLFAKKDLLTKFQLFLL